MMIKTLLALTCGVLVSACVYGQTCTQRLNQAEDDYEAGRLLGIPNQLMDCLITGQFTKEEEIRAKKLLTLVYIFTDQEAKAESAMIDLLKADPEHRLNPQVDPTELFYLYNQFRTKPIFRVSFKGGVNFSKPKVIRSYGTYNTGLYESFYNGKTPDGKTSYKINDSTTVSALSGLGIGVYGEILLEREIGNGLELALGPQVRFSAYHVDSYLNQADVNTTVTNNQVYIRAPMLLRYTLWSDDRDRKWLPYVYGGVSLDRLISAKYTEGSRRGGTSYTTTSGDLIKAHQVNLWNYSLFCGIGAKIRMKTHFITLEARYDNSRMNYIKGSNRWSNPESTFNLGYVESDLKLNFLSFSVGYTRSIYKPKKLTSK